MHVRAHPAKSMGVRPYILSLLPVVILASCATTYAPSMQQSLGNSEAPDTFAEKVQGLEFKAGLWDLYIDHRQGKILAALPAAQASGKVDAVLHIVGLLTGLGSNPVGLDRGQLSKTRIIEIRRVGPQLLFELPNYAYRALSQQPEEQQAVRHSFARSVIWSPKILAESPDKLLIDLSPLLLGDAHGVADTLKRAQQGVYRLDKDRSLVELDATLAFPDNLELEALLTFSGGEPGDEVRSTSPDPKAISLIQHQAFVRLPEEGYIPRTFDPRAGSFAIHFHDYAAPLDAPLEKRWIVRHRLEKVSPEAATSRVKEPIIYYLDRGTPEPVRTALLEGARWWAEAFEKAGFIDAFRVEMLPEGAHPLDVRYNVIQWVHRSTRGWSYGGGVVDPRTGEMLKGHVTLGSLRVRQDRRLFEGLIGTTSTATDQPKSQTPIQLALARLRQLAAHEVGHTLGLAHNFATSSYKRGRASVMDYPAPLVRVVDRKIDTSKAYAIGIGDWDIHAIRYAYSQFAPGQDEANKLQEIISEGLAKNFQMVSDNAARPPSAALPHGSLWDNGRDLSLALQEAMAVRRLAMANFGIDRVAQGQPIALLEEVFVPIYLHHRYQVEATIKAIGGLTVSPDTLASHNQAPVIRPIPAPTQRAALSAALHTLSAQELDIPERILQLLPPRPFGYGTNRERFSSQTAPAFDALGAAFSAANHTLNFLLEPHRLGRLVDQHRRGPHLPSVAEVFNALDAVVFKTQQPTPRLRRVQETVQQAVLNHWFRLASKDNINPHVRSQAYHKLIQLLRHLRQHQGKDREAIAHQSALQRYIQWFLDRGVVAPIMQTPPPMPPGSPIGHACTTQLPATFL